MKKISLALTAFVFLGCAGPSLVPAKRETPVNLWDEISAELARLYTMVETYNQTIKKESSLLEVVAEPWDYPKGQTVSIMKPSKEIKYSVIKIADAKVPTQKGVLEARIVKALGARGATWLAVDKKYAPVPEVYAALSKGVETVTWEGEKIPLYTFGALIDDAEAIPAIKRFVRFDSLIDKAYKKITRQIEGLQKKYENSPIYIDGFTVNIGIAFSFAINFKIREH